MPGRDKVESEPWSTFYAIFEAFTLSAILTGQEKKVFAFF